MAVCWHLHRWLTAIFRPMLTVILLISAFGHCCGVGDALFLARGAAGVWKAGALAAGWILTIYPESLLLAAQPCASRISSLLQRWPFGAL
jgi:hypothetical protein